MNISHATNPSETTYSRIQYGDGTWLGSKIYGTEPFDTIYLEPDHFGEEVFREEDGVLYMKEIREFDGKDWHVFLPGLGTRDTFERGMPQDVKIRDYVLYKGGVKPQFEMGLAGDWTNLGFNDYAQWMYEKSWVGEFDPSVREFEMQFDYVRIYKPADK